MKKINFLSIVCLVGLLIAGCSQKEDQFQVPDDSATLKSASIVADYDMVPNEIIVKFKEGTETSKKALVFEMLGGKLKEKILTKMMEKHGDLEGITLISTSGSVSDALAKAKKLPEIEYAEPNYIYQHCATSDDTYYTNGLLWGMYGDATDPANQYGSQAGEAWAAGHTGSSTVYIGIIDEGYMYAHEDLNANAGTNPGEVNGSSGVDDDKNDYVDDIYGWDFDGGNSTVYDGTVDDHGTHVAGTIGAVGGNYKGVAGVCWNVKLLNAKFLGATGGTTTNAIKAVDYFTNLKTRAVNKVNVIATNNSWGGGGYSTELYNAIERANKAGILFIAAAGNEKRNIDRKASYPAAYPNANIISVASITSTGLLSSFSNYGATKVDLGAPGSGIWSTLPDNKYGSYSGTSMATPHVTGAAALYASTKSLILITQADAAAIKKAILDAATLTPTSSLSGKCVTGGRLNVSGF